MRKLVVGPTFAVFVVFFGVAMLDAVRHREWLLASVFTVLAVLFFREDGRNGQRYP